MCAILEALSRTNCTVWLVCFVLCVGGVLRGRVSCHNHYRPHHVNVDPCQNSIASSYLQAGAATKPAAAASITEVARQRWQRPCSSSSRAQPTFPAAPPPMLWRRALSVAQATHSNSASVYATTENLLLLHHTQYVTDACQFKARWHPRKRCGTLPRSGVSRARWTRSR